MDTLSACRLMAPQSVVFFFHDAVANTPASRLLLKHDAGTRGTTSTAEMPGLQPAAALSVAPCIPKGLWWARCLEVVQATPTGPAHCDAIHSEFLAFHNGATLQCHCRGQSEILASETRKVDELFMRHFMCVIYQTRWILAVPDS